MALRFYPRGASDARVIAKPCSCVCICLCVTCRYCIKTAKHRITQTTPRDSPETLVFGRQNLLVDDLLPPEICAENDPPPFQTAQYWPIIAQRLNRESWRKNVQLELIRSRPRAFQRAVDEPCTLPLGPPKVGTNAILLFFSKFEHLSKKVCYKVFGVKTSSSKVVAIIPLSKGP